MKRATSAARGGLPASLACDAGNPDAHYLLGRLAAERDPRSALDHFSAALKTVPGSPDVLLALGQVQMAMHDRAAAVRSLDELLDEAGRSNLWPRRQAWALAHVSLARLEPAAAEAHWRQAWSIDPQTAAESSLFERRELPRVLETFRDAARSAVGLVLRRPTTA